MPCFLENVLVLVFVFAVELDLKASRDLFILFSLPGMRIPALVLQD